MSDYRQESSWSVRAAAGEPFAVVQVRGLQTVLQAAKDAWGRPSVGQPVSISAELSFASPFATAASDDKLGADTVHYGNLSKAILASIDHYRPANLADLGQPPHQLLSHVLERIWSKLTGRRLNGAVAASGDAFLQLDKVRFLSITLFLPKASLLGEGASLTVSSVFAAQIYSYSYRIHSLRVPTLIGVNAIERENKQFVVTDVEVDRCYCIGDVYTILENIVVKEMESSCFETLEALCAHLIRAIRAVDCNILAGAGEGAVDPTQWTIRISLAKPTAVPFADSPLVQVVSGPHVPA